MNIRSWFSRHKADFRPAGLLTYRGGQGEYRENGIHSPLDKRVSRWRRIGWVVLFGFIGSSVAWAATARLDGAAIARGEVTVESNRKAVQHLEGGIVKAILVREGQKVAAGEPLLQLDDTLARSRYRMLESQYYSLLAEEARLAAERDGANDIAFPEELLQRAGEEAIAKLIVSQVDIFNSRRKRGDTQKRILRERIAQLERGVTGLQARLEAQKSQLALLQEERGAIEALWRKGLARKSQFLALQRREADLQGRIADLRAQIDRNRDNIAEIRYQMSIPADRLRSQVSEDLRRVRDRLADVGERMLAARDTLARLTVRAPQEGTVVGMKVHTPGGVVQPGEVLMELVPEQDSRIVEARIDPKDIDDVHIGMTARVRISAFNARTTPMLSGVVTDVSADRFTDPISGRAYFTARIRMDDGGGQAPLLVPGMQADVFLVTRERTVLDYLLEPVSRNFEKAGRET